MYTETVEKVADIEFKFAISYRFLGTIVFPL